MAVNSEFNAAKGEEPNLSQKRTDSLLEWRLFVAWMKRLPCLDLDLQLLEGVEQSDRRYSRLSDA